MSTLTIASIYNLSLVYVFYTQGLVIGCEPEDVYR